MTPDGRPGPTAMWPNQHPSFEIKFPSLVEWCIVGTSLSPCPLPAPCDRMFPTTHHPPHGIICIPCPLPSDWGLVPTFQQS